MGKKALKTVFSRLYRVMPLAVFVFLMTLISDMGTWLAMRLNGEKKSEESSLLPYEAPSFSIFNQAHAIPPASVEEP